MFDKREAGGNENSERVEFQKVPKIMIAAEDKHTGEVASLVPNKSYLEAFLLMRPWRTRFRPPGLLKCRC